ncbi:hypothetical protein JOC34_003530 [Virgibacillus halotolerans]|uniref:hypothetical protein n=1 Tax=Virgibacillus halotolerans TaxID=1071053 RepID=UPI00195FC81A|nr:hypothetical protein [Virgibacillus halotolerans]MBM7601109.1 hypothetical protein [Virgibacillus halotolerans]
MALKNHWKGMGKTRYIKGSRLVHHRGKYWIRSGFPFGLVAVLGIEKSRVILDQIRDYVEAAVEIISVYFNEIVLEIVRIYSL